MEIRLAADQDHGDARQQRQWPADALYQLLQDHFDGSGSSFTNFYAPLNTSRVRYSSSLSTANSGKYVDACRFVRLDGYYRPPA